MTIVNVQIEGELERFVKAFVRAGYASSKAEVIRAALRDFERHNSFAQEDSRQMLKEDRAAGLRMAEGRLRKIWDNPKDDEFWARYK